MAHFKEKIMQNSTRLILTALLSLALAPCLAAAQSDKPAKAEAETQPAPSETKTPKLPPQPLLMMVTVKSSETGKTIQEKYYSLTGMANYDRYEPETIRDGNRVTYTGEKGNGFIAHIVAHRPCLHLFCRVWSEQIHG
jgi:hypothetical protein